MDTRISVKHSPNFGKFIVLKRAKKPFNKFKKINNIGTQEDKDIFEKYIKAVEKLQEDNPINIVVDYLRLGKNKSKKLALVLTNGYKRVTKPQSLLSGFDEYPYIMNINADSLTYTKGTPKYLQQILSISDVADTTKTFLSKKAYENTQSFSWDLDDILGPVDTYSRGTSP
ncbi:MAG: hypothetical protein WCY19_03365 [Candidatus Gastranaerophilaceae bacterium]